MLTSSNPAALADFLNRPTAPFPPPRFESMEFCTTAHWLMDRVTNQHAHGHGRLVWNSFLDSQL